MPLAVLSRGKLPVSFYSSFNLSMPFYITVLSAAIMFPVCRLIISTLYTSSVVVAAAAVSSPSQPVLYDNTWSGPAQLQQNGSASFSSVEALLIIPQHLELPTHPENVVDQYSASFWVGIDGWKSRGLWQAGVVMHLWEDGTREFVPFWEW